MASGAASAHTEPVQANSSARSSGEHDGVRSTDMEESPHMCCAACNQILPPLDDDLSEAIRSMKLHISTENILRQYGIRHLRQILNLQDRQLLEAGMKLPHVRTLQNLA